MPQFRSTRLVRHTPQQMFALVADIERYPEFLPLCEALRIMKREKDSEGNVALIAQMQVGYKAIRETFVTRVTLSSQELVITAEYIDGPFKHLENIWQFNERNGFCAIDFFINYEFKNRMLGLLMGAMFDKAFRKFSESFEKRADLIYGIEE